VTSGNAIKGRSQAHIDKMARKAVRMWTTGFTHVQSKHNHPTDMRYPLACRKYAALLAQPSAGISRHTNETHLDLREVARMGRQKDRMHHNYMMNGGFTRRGNEAGPVAGYDDWIAIKAASL